MSISLIRAIPLGAFPVQTGRLFIQMEFRAFLAAFRICKCTVTHRISNQRFSFANSESTTFYL